MTKTRLAAALSSALLFATVTQAATYRVVEIPTVELGKNSFASAINSSGEVTFNIESPTNVPIDLTLLNFESETLIDNLEDVQAASTGDFTDADYEFLLAFIKSGDGSSRSQQIADTISYLYTNDSAQFIAGFDQPIEQSSQFTLSTSTNVRDINDAGLSVGRAEGFYSKFDYVNDSSELITYFLHDFGVRAFVNLGDSNIGLPAPATQAGGYSEAFAINNNNQVVGYGSTMFTSDAVETATTNCEDEDIRGDIPYESCISNIVTTFTGAPTSFAELRGLIWQLDDSGNVIDTKELGLLFEPEDDDALNYSSQAVAINDNGIAVGSSNGLYIENDTTVTRNFGVIFDNDQVINLTPDPDRNVARTSSTISTAVDINNDNLITGYQIKQVNGVNRTKFFVYDMNQQEMTFPEDFFLGSSSVPFDINNNGLVVGQGEVDASLTGRRKEGFLYDHNTATFSDFRSLISCDSPYTIVQANSINDEGVVAATALYQGPARSSKGEILLDSEGNEVIIDKVTAVKLIPIPNGEVESCDDPTDEINRERQGASVSWLLSLGFMILIWRRFRNSI